MNPDPTARSMIRLAMKAPYLERTEEYALALRWRDERDQEALHRIATAHLRLVVSVAAKFRRFGLPMNDLVQEGNVGLLKAAARFEPERNVRFATYAAWWVRSSIQDYILRNWSIVRGGTSSTQKALFFNVRRLRARIARGSEPLSNREIYKEIAVALGVSDEEVALMDSRLAGPDASLNMPATGDGENPNDRVYFLASEDPLPDEIVGDTIDIERRTVWLRDALEVLNERELTIIRKRRLQEEGATLESLGEMLGISKERVRQIESRALKKLRGALVDANPELAAECA
jgi:RNA polymerase sigma-32 factor